MSRWTDIKAIKSKLDKRWQTGDLLRALRRPDTLFPLRLPLKQPSSPEMGDCFVEVRDWVQSWQTDEANTDLALEWRSVQHRQVGRNALPRAVLLDTPEQALRLLRRQADADRFLNLCGRLRDAFPELDDWIDRNPLKVLELADDWPALMAVLHWLRDHPRPGVYLRQLEIPGVDTKFIERRRAVLIDLLDQVLPFDAVDRDAVGAKAFERRYGFRDKPVILRFRILDPTYALQGLTDLSIPVEDFARLNLAIERVFVVENEITALAFPDKRSSMVVCGMGYGIDRHLARADWLADKAIFYWGDIDTHGFQILSRVRAALPHTRSLLMDRATLMDHQSLWGQEPKPIHHDLHHLDPHEQALYRDLADNRLGDRVRLEQERIGFERLRRVV